MNNKYLPTIISGVGLIVLLALASAVGLGLRTQAQDTAPTWEYAALMYDGSNTFAFTGDTAATNEINKTLNALGDNGMNIIAAMNIMGNEGWEYISSQNAGAGVDMLVFKRAK